MLSRIDRHLQRLGYTDPDWEWSFLLGVNAMPLLYYHVPQETRYQKMQTSFLSYFKKKSEEPSIDPKKADDDPVNPDKPQPRHSPHQ
jgi:hypothetical protein